MLFNQLWKSKPCFNLKFALTECIIFVHKVNCVCDSAPREGGDIRLFITIVPKVLSYQLWRQLLNFDWLVHEVECPSFQPLIVICRRRNFACHHWGCTLTKRLLSYPLDPYTLLPYLRLNVAIFVWHMIPICNMLHYFTNHEIQNIFHNISNLEAVFYKDLHRY